MGGAVGADLDIVAGGTGPVERGGIEEDGAAAGLEGELAGLPGVGPGGLGFTAMLFEAALQAEHQDQHGIGKNVLAILVEQVSRQVGEEAVARAEDEGISKRAQHDEQPDMQH